MSIAWVQRALIVSVGESEITRSHLGCLGEVAAEYPKPLRGVNEKRTLVVLVQQHACIQRFGPFNRRQ
jgi:hypothetical protein